MIINNSPIEILKQLMQRRNWYQGRIERRLAAVTKQNAIAGKLSHDKASAILMLLGWRKTKDETWQLIADSGELTRTGEENLKIATAAIKAIYPEPTKPMSKKLKFSKRKG